MKHILWNIATLIFDLYWPVPKFTFYLQNKNSKGLFLVPIVYHIKKNKGLGRKLRPAERVKGPIKKKDKDNDKNRIIGVLASSCLEGQH